MTDTPTPVSAEAPAPDLVTLLLFRSSDEAGIGWTPSTVVHVPAGLLHNAADEITRLTAELHIATEWSARVHAGQQEDADTITSLTAKAERLRAALEKMKEMAEYWINLQLGNMKTEGVISKERYDTWLALGHQSKAMSLARAALTQELRT